jgi:hypothetical protein
MVLVQGIDKVWAVDLIDMQHYAEDNGNFKYILAVIDVFSKFGCMSVLKQKTGTEDASAINDIITSSGRKPKQVCCDKGTEFYNRHVNKLVGLYSTENEDKSCVVERLNRTMKDRMFKYFTANNTRRYFDVLNDMVSQYNNTKPSAIKMAPVNASNPENLYQSYLNLYGDIVRDISPELKPKFKVADKIRITVKKDVFRKGYLLRWTEDLFIVSAGSIALFRQALSRQVIYSNFRQYVRYLSMAYVPIFKWSIDWVEELMATLHADARCRKESPLPPRGFDK